MGFTYTLRTGGPAQFAHAAEVAPGLIGEDPNDIGRLWGKMVWAGASVGRSGVATQAIAAIDTALCMGMAMEQFNLEWLEELLDAYDVEGHATMAAQLVTPVGTGEMLTSAGEVAAYIKRGAIDLVMRDAPRVGGITPFLKVAVMAEDAGLVMAPHFVMEIHLQLAAAYPHAAWVEHFEWLEPAFNERLEICDGHMIVPNRPGHGFTLHEQIAGWTVAQTEIGKRA